MKHIIIGAGPAGVRAAETIRKQAPNDEITLVSGEPGKPYARMAVPYVLSGNIDEHGTLQRKEEDYFENLKINYLNGKAIQVTATDHGGTVELADSTKLEYDRLLVATGSSPHLPPVPGIDMAGCITCWTLSDARTIAECLKPGAKVVLLGAGFVAGVIMKPLVESGADLTVIAGRSGQILRSMMTPTGSQMLQHWLESKGVHVVTRRQC